MNDPVSYGADEVITFGGMFMSQLKKESSQAEFEKLEKTLSELEQSFEDTNGMEFITIGKSNPGNSTLNICGWLHACTDKNIEISEHARKAFRNTTALQTYKNKYDRSAQAQPKFTLGNESKTAQELVDEELEYQKDKTQRQEARATEFSNKIYNKLDELEGVVKDQIIHIHGQVNKGKEDGEALDLFKSYLQTINQAKHSFDTKSDNFVAEPSTIMSKTAKTFETLQNETGKMLENDKIKYGKSNTGFLKIIKTWLKDTFSLFKSESRKILETQHEQTSNIAESLKAHTSPKK